MENTKLGIDFVNQLDEWNGAANRVLFNGSGVAIGDLNNDGLPDLFFCGLDSPNQLYRNEGNWRFSKVEIPPAIEQTDTFSRGAVFADLDGDQRLDLIFGTLDQGIFVFLNEGNFQFSNVSSSLKDAQASHGPMTFALADIDHNQTLDLYIVNNRRDDIRDRARVPITRSGGKISPSPELADRIFIHESQIHEYGEPDQLLLNDGTGRFTPVPWTSGRFRENGKSLTEAPKDWGLSAMFRDFNHDGHPDLYVCNDYWTPDRIWINDGNGGFDAADKEAFPITSASSMGVDAADIENDGDWDLFIVDMLSRDLAQRRRQLPATNLVANDPARNGPRRQVNHNTLLVATPDQGRAELSYFAGLPASDWSWCPIFLDVDLDGYQDVLISAGYAHDMQDRDTLRLIRSKQHSWNPNLSESERQRAFTREMRDHIRLYPKLNLPLIAFKNQRNGRFQEATELWGTNVPGVHQGFASADLDGDGDLDLVTNRLNDSPAFFRNNASQTRIKLTLIGLTPNTQAIGARITLHQTNVPSQLREVIAGGRYLSGSDTALVFATHGESQDRTLEIRWSNGNRTRIEDLASNTHYTIHESSVIAENPTPKPPSAKTTLFEDQSHRLNHRAETGRSHGFKQQPLRPWSLSHSGPGVTTLDFNQDSFTDIVIGSEYARKPILFRYQPDGRFTTQPFQSGLWSDSAGMIGLPRPHGPTHLFAAMTGNESTGKASLIEFDLQGRQRSIYQNLIRGATSLAAGPRYGKGTLSLFVGGSSIPGAYPQFHPSFLLDQKDNGAWQRDVSFDSQLGLVQEALWSDLTQDGFPELLVSTEWGPIRVFENQAGQLIDRTREWGFAQTTGLWRGLATGDIDGNGHLDILAGNWGLNSTYQASESRPLTLCYGELTRPGLTDLLETEYLPNGELTLRRPWDDLTPSLPFLTTRVKGSTDYSQRSLNELLGEKINAVNHVSATTLESTLFLNHGTGRFERRTLPASIQWAPVNGIQILDLDGDGHSDALVGQNFSHTREGLPPQNSGRLLVLQGNGSGNLNPLPKSSSGIKITGNIRGLAIADFNQDARPDFVLTQNEGPTKLYYSSETSTMGLRVRLQGASPNPLGIGAQIWTANDAGNIGPIQEIQAGSGWWSQSDAVKVVTRVTDATKLTVRWPGGQLQSVPLGEQTEIVVRQP